MPAVISSTFIRVPIDKLHQYVSNPGNWEHIFEDVTATVETNGTGEAGSGGTFKVSEMGIRRIRKFIVAESSLSSENSFVKLHVEEEKEWITFSSVRKDDGVQVTCTAEYHLPDNIFGKLADILMFERSYENFTCVTLDRLKLLCEGL